MNCLTAGFALRSFTTTGLGQTGSVDWAIGEHKSRYGLQISRDVCRKTPDSSPGSDSFLSKPLDEVVQVGCSPLFFAGFLFLKDDGHLG